MSNHAENDLRVLLSLLPTEQLNRILENSIENDEISVEAINAVLSVLEERGELTDAQDPQTALQKLQKYFNTPDGVGQSLYPETAPASMPPTTVATPRKTRRVLRVAALIAACMGVIFSCMLVAQAIGVDVFGRLGKWTDDVFRFSENVPQAPSVPQAGYESTDALQGALAQIGIPTSFAPSRIPEGYTLFSLEKSCGQTYNAVYATFSDESGGVLTMDFYDYADPAAVPYLQFEKNAGDPQTCCVNGRIFYLFSNEGSRTAVWSDASYVISIGGNLPEESILQIVTSIEGSSYE